MSEDALKALEKAKTELAEKKTAYKTTISILHEIRKNIKIKERKIVLLEEVYNDAISDEILVCISGSNNTEEHNPTTSSQF